MPIRSRITGHVRKTERIMEAEPFAKTNATRMDMTPRPTKTTPTPGSATRPLKVWAERRPEPDWDRFVAALVALALSRVEEAKEDQRD